MGEGMGVVCFGKDLLEKGGRGRNHRGGGEEIIGGREKKKHRMKGGREE